MTRHRHVPLLDLASELAPLRAELDAAWARVLDSSQFVLGPEVEAFEHEVAQALDVRHAVALNSGTDALLIALRALGVGPGDEVITSPFSFFATSEVVQTLGATPVFVDIADDGFAIDADLVEGAITARTKALLPVHLYGASAPMTRLLGVAARHGLVVLEDAAQAFGAHYACACAACRDTGACAGGGGADSLAGRALGTLGDAGAFSFYPTKNLGAYGDGGMLVTPRDDVAAAARRLRNHGGVGRYQHESTGYNSRLDALQAAILRVKLPHLPTWVRARRRLAARYDDLLDGLPGVRAPKATIDHVYHQYTVLVGEGRRDGVAEALRADGVDTMVYYPRTLESYGGRVSGDLRCAHAAAAGVLSLPIYPTLDERDQDHVVASLRRALGV
ncbi:DegT/DnrJ/EryC1/StrS family aminotransferase [soil metagenome]